MSKRSVALLIKDVCLHHLGLSCVNTHANCGGVLVYCFKRALHISVVAGEKYDIVSISEMKA